MRARTKDTCPPAEEDYCLDFAGYFNCESRCRIRVYRPVGLPVVIVATELPENPGTSITNRAELVHCIAWYRAGQPVPVLFIEHYPGWPNPHCRSEEEQFDHVRFPRDMDAWPLRVSRLGGLRTTMFQAPSWQHLTRTEFLLITTGKEE